MPTNYGADKAQTEPVSGCAAASLEPDKAVEYDVAIGFRNAGTAIGNLEHGVRVLAVAERPHRKLSTTGIFEGIVEQIGERLRHQMAIAANFDARLDGHNQSKPPFFGRRLIEFGGGTGPPRQDR